MAFPQIVGTLMQQGFESYAIDYRRATATYFLPDGDSVVLPTRHSNNPIAPTMDTAAIQESHQGISTVGAGLHLCWLLRDGHDSRVRGLHRVVPW